MKHFFRKLQLSAPTPDPADQRRPKPAPKPAPKPPPHPAPPSASAPLAPPSASSTAPPSPAASSSSAAAEGSSSSRVTGGGNYGLFEEEYEVQLALAISESDPDRLEDFDSVQMNAAKRMSLGCSTSVADGSGSSGGGGGGDMEFLSLRYWSYNVVNYDEKLMDGFYDVYGGITSTPNVQDKIPSLEDLQAVSVSENIDYQVVLVNRVLDHPLQQLEKKAVSFALRSKAEERGIIASGLVQKIADLVVRRLGGPVGDTNDIMRRWTAKSHQLRRSLNTIVLPLGSLEVGLSRHRALLFKVLADRINLPCKLVKGRYYTGTDEGAVNFIKVDYDSEYIVDLMGAPGTLIPTETSSSNIESSGSFLLGPDTMEQTVKDLCLALDNANSQFGRTSEIPEGNSDVSLATEHGSHPNEISMFEHEQEDDKGISASCPTENTENRSGKHFELTGGASAENLRTKEAITPAQQMKVDDVSKYVATAAKDPEFAQKLHAVLLESGAFLPPDLFSELGSSVDVVKKDTWNSGGEDGEVKNEGQLTQVATISLVPHSDLDLSSGSNNDNEQQFCINRNTQKQLESSGRGKNLIDTGTTSSTGTTNDWLLVHETQVTGSSLHNFTEPVFANINMSGALCHEQGNISSASCEAQTSERNYENVIRLLDLTPCHQINASDACEFSSEHYQGNTRDSTVEFVGKEENLQLIDSHVGERVNSVVDGVAEWEIPWEELQIGERIGLGSYGEVYRADWNGTEVAVKKLFNQGLSGDALEQFRCEVKIMLRLRHPNVVLFMGAVTRSPNLSILTEFLPRGSLYRLLHRPNVQLDEKRRLKMALDVAKGMNYLHTGHPPIVHRDLKSPNLLVDKNWVVKVCDFGMSRLKHHTFLSSKSTAGTPEWMAPEVLRNEPSNEKCDVYSFGVILWELVTLRMPWSGMNPMQVVGAVGFQNRRLEIPKEVDPTIAKIISDCWESEPSRRPSFAQLLSPLKKLQRLVVAVDRSLMNMDC